MDTSIYTAQFGAFPIRFVLKDGDVFVSRDDLFAAMNDCFVPNSREFAVQFFDFGLNMVGDSGDKRSTVLGDSVIGAAIHFHAVGNLLDSICDIARNPSVGATEAGEDLRESCFRTHALLEWYLATLSQVDEYFGRSIAEMMSSVKSRLDRLNPPFIVNVSHDSECGMWIAVCDEIGLVTEAETYEELTERVWEIAPEIAVENGISITDETMRLSFQQNQAASDRISL